jgi:hypothetical protein
VINELLRDANIPVTISIGANSSVLAARE